MKETLTLQMLKDMKPGIFDTGEIINSPVGIYMTDQDIGRRMRWVASRGNIHDWAIYIHWADKDKEYIRNHGDKCYNSDYIKHLVPCDNEAFEMYRF